MSITRPTPIAEQVNQILRTRIRDGSYAPGKRLPSESELSRQLDVSRATVRTVLAGLEAEGLILRKQGDGTYVNLRIQDVNTHLGGLWEFSRLIESSGRQPAIKELTIQPRPADDNEAECLALPLGSLVLGMERLFFADDQPVILVANAIPLHFLDQSAAPFDGRLHIREFLRRYSNRKIAYAITDLRAALATERIAQFLERASGSPLLKIAITFYDRDNRPIICGQSYYDDAALHLRLVQAWG